MWEWSDFRPIALSLSPSLAHSLAQSLIQEHHFELSKAELCETCFCGLHNKTSFVFTQTLPSASVATSACNKRICLFCHRNASKYEQPQAGALHLQLTSILSSVKYTVWAKYGHFPTLVCKWAWCPKSSILEIVNNTQMTAVFKCDNYQESCSTRLNCTCLATHTWCLRLLLVHTRSNNIRVKGQWQHECSIAMYLYYKQNVLRQQSTRYRPLTNQWNLSIDFKLYIFFFLLNKWM